MTKTGKCSHCGSEITGGIRNGREGWIHADPAAKFANGLHGAFPSN